MVSIQSLVLRLISAFICMNFILASTSTLALPPPPQLINVVDVSPDTPFGSTLISWTYPNSGGRIYSLALNPLHNKIIYAVSEGAGVWKSIDAGHNWTQASVGLLNGHVPANHHLLAIDASTPRRLLLATASDDGRVGGPYGGLYVSTDAAAHWRHVNLPVNQSSSSQPAAGLCPTTGGEISTVAFSTGQAFVMTPCGLFTNADPGLADGKWVQLEQLTFSPGGAVMAQNSFGSAIFVCQGSSIYLSNSLGKPGTWTELATLGAGTACYDITVAPFASQKQPTTVAVIYGVPKSTQYPAAGQEVALVGPAGVGPVLGFNALFTAKNSSAGYGSGVPSVYAVRKASAKDNNPGDGIDVFAADNYHFYLYEGSFPGGTWKILNNLHADSWSMAFPANYDPGAGVCSAYASHDGGITWNTSSKTNRNGGCFTTDGWVTAMSGLHTLETYSIEGVSQQLSSLSCRTCTTTVYLANGDNDVWAIWDGGAKSGVLVDTLGDAGDVHVDAAYPQQVLLTRGLCSVVATSTTASAPLPGATVTSGAGCGAGQHGLSPPNFTAGPCSTSNIGNLGPCPLGPGNPTLTQVKALAGETVASPTYYAVVAQAGQPDQIVVSTAIPPGPSSWSPVETGSAVGFFPSNTIMQLRSSGGVLKTILWVLAIDQNGNGQVYQGTVINGKVNKWLPASGSGVTSIGNAGDLIVNPYNSNFAWVTDLQSSSIKWTSNGLAVGGQSWNTSQSLTNIAVNDGTFNFRFGCHDAFFDNTCSLSSMSFSRSNANIAVAALYPGGVAYSNTSGTQWAALPDVLAGPTPTIAGNLPGYPITVWYDDNPFTGASIYASFHWNRTVRIYGKFDSLPEH